MSINSKYTLAKKAFEDGVSLKNFVELETTVQYLDHLHALKESNFKFALLIGAPGTGKSMLLHRFYQETSKGVYLFERPFFSQEEFKKRLSKLLELNPDTFFEDLTQKVQEPLLFLLDEAQFYKEDFLEFLRILSDTGKIKMVLALHSLEKDDILAQKHFKTRTYTTIYIKPPSKKELQIYLQKRLFIHQLQDISQAVNSKVTSFIYRFTKGNLRETNLFMSKLFEIMEYFDLNHPTKIDTSKIQTKFLEMSAIDLGFIDA